MDDLTPSAAVLMDLDRRRLVHPLHHPKEHAGAHLFVEGRGAMLRTADGKEYIDYYLGSASIVLGHAHPAVVDAVRRQAEWGSNFFEVSPATLALAQLVVESVPCAEVLKYAPTGTEAVATSLRIARANSSSKT